MSPKYIIEAFRQQKANCACVAFIKALLFRFGSRKSFSVRQQDNYLLIRLRNNEMILLSKADIRRINKKNSIQFKTTPVVNKRLKQFVATCFAVMVRQMQLKGLSGKQYTEDAAIKTLTRKGVETTHFHQLLGIKRTKAQPLTLKKLSTLRKKRVLFLVNEGHITISSMGWFEDLGVAMPLGKEIPVVLNKKMKNYYSIQ